jgi:hypothetical protein
MLVLVGAMIPLLVAFGCERRTAGEPPAGSGDSPGQGEPIRLSDSFCAAGGVASTADGMQGVFCLSPPDSAAGRKSTGSHGTWLPGAIWVLAGNE